MPWSRTASCSRARCTTSTPGIRFFAGSSSPAIRKSSMPATALDFDPASQKVTSFKKAFRDAFPTEAEPDVHTALAYDGFRMLVEAMKGTATQLTPERVRDELLKTKDFAGLTGALTIPADRVVERPLFVVRWQDRVVTPVKMYAP